MFLKRINTHNISSKYYSFPIGNGYCEEYSFGNSHIKENERLIQDKQFLLNFYSGIKNRLLLNGNLQIPYETLCNRIDEIKLEINDSYYKIPPIFSNMFDYINNNIEHNQLFENQNEYQILVRARTWSENKLSIEKTGYAEAASTNMIVDLGYKTNKCVILFNNVVNHPISTIREYDLALSESSNTYPSFRKSSLANPIGVAAIAITTDNKLILVHRSQRVSSYANKIGPTSSGYVTWADVCSSRDNTLNSLLTTSLRREISEELYLNPCKETSNLYPLGFFREFYRAGMPQAFYCFRIYLDSDTLIKRIRYANNYREFTGIITIQVNQSTLSKIIPDLLISSKIGNLDIGLEAQGILGILVSFGKDRIFSQ